MPRRRGNAIERRILGKVFCFQREECRGFSDEDNIEEKWALKRYLTMGDLKVRIEKGSRRRMRRALLSVMVIVMTIALAATAAIAAIVTWTGGICNGTPDRDEITGSTTADDIRAMGSVDLVSARAGGDIVRLGPGGTPRDMEFAEGGLGRDQLYGGTGSDELNDIQPTDDNDQPIVINDRDQLYGRGNDDFLYAIDGDSRDTLNGGPGADDCYGDPEDTIVNCENESTSTSISRASSAPEPRIASVLLR